jgi:hypothetical protein
MLCTGTARGHIQTKLSRKLVQDISVSCELCEASNLASSASCNEKPGLQTRRKWVWGRFGGSSRLIATLSLGVLRDGDLATDPTPVRLIDVVGRPTLVEAAVYAWRSCQRVICVKASRG